MTCHFDGVARVRATVVQGFPQGSSLGFERPCKGCNPHARSCLTYVRAHARLCMRVSLHKTLATVATLAPLLTIPCLSKALAFRDPARVAQGLVDDCKASLENDHDCTPEFAFTPVRRAGGMRATACRPTRCCGYGADERCSIDTASRLRAGDRGGIDVADRDGSARGADRGGVGCRDDAPLTITAGVAGPFGAAAAWAVRLSAALRCSDLVSLYELRELNRSQGGVS